MHWTQNVYTIVLQTPFTNLQLLPNLLKLCRLNRFKIEFFIPFLKKLLFLHVCRTSLLKTLWEKEKVFVTSNFSFSLSVFWQFGELSAIFIKLKNCHLQTFSIWTNLKFCNFVKLYRFNIALGSFNKIKFKNILSKVKNKVSLLISHNVFTNAVNLNFYWLSKIYKFNSCIYISDVSSENHNPYQSSEKIMFIKYNYA